ncbi:MAG: CopG family transcriptional regulator [bacterium]|nr:CopG family transcriptional regulator [bacterium]
MAKSGATTIQTEIPISLASQAQKLVEAGWFRNLDELFLDALRRFLESHREEWMEDFIRVIDACKRRIRAYDA